MIMNQPIRIAIVGYGNLGRGVEAAVARCPDMSLSAIYSRRPAASIQTLFGNAPVYEMEALNGRANETDVFVLCGGSKEDLPRQGPQLAALGNTVDSFDTHARIAEYFSAMDEAARAAGRQGLPFRDVAAVSESGGVLRSRQAIGTRRGSYGFRRGAGLRQVTGSCPDALRACQKKARNRSVAGALIPWTLSGVRACFSCWEGGPSSMRWRGKPDGR